MQTIKYAHRLAEVSLKAPPPSVSRLHLSQVPTVLGGWGWVCGVALRWQAEREADATAPFSSQSRPDLRTLHLSALCFKWAVCPLGSYVLRGEP